HAVDRARIREDDIVLVIGAGPIGLGAIQFAILTGARVLAMDIDPGKLDTCREITGLQEFLLATGEVESKLKDLLNGDLPTVILDATGNAQSMMRTFDYVAAGGSIVFIGLFIGEVVFHDPTFHKKELTLMASRAALSQDFTRIIELVEKGKIDPASFITHRLTFDLVPTDFEQLYAPGSNLVKAVIEL
ncbi:MAG: zinc-binding dehydrogenase, partial [Bacteroidota bacterium]